jgi:hypothetical protein
MAGFLKHVDDDGDLSIFCSSDSILFACNRGHYWTVEAQMDDAQPPDEETISLDGLPRTFMMHRQAIAKALVADV